MARRHMPHINPEVVRHDRGWAIWLGVIVVGVLIVFALTAMAVSLLIHG
jgi:hypothetical protein